MKPPTYNTQTESPPNIYNLPSLSFNFRQQMSEKPTYDIVKESFQKSPTYNHIFSQVSTQPNLDLTSFRSQISYSSKQNILSPYSRSNYGRILHNALNQNNNFMKQYQKYLPPSLAVSIQPPVAVSTARPSGVCSLSVFTNGHNQVKNTHWLTFRLSNYNFFAYFNYFSTIIINL